MSNLSDSDKYLDDEDKLRQDLKDIILKKENRKNLYNSIIVFFISLTVFTLSLIFGLRSFTSRVNNLNNILVNPPNLNKLHGSYKNFFDSTYNLNKNLDDLKNIKINNHIDKPNDQTIPGIDYFKELQYRKLDIEEIITVIKINKKKLDKYIELEKKNKGSHKWIIEETKDEIIKNIRLLKSNLNKFNNDKTKITGNVINHKKYYENIKELIEISHENLLKNIINYNKFFDQYNFIKRLTFTILEEYNKNTKNLVDKLNIDQFKTFNLFSSFESNDNLYFSLEFYNSWIENSAFPNNKLPILTDSIILCTVSFKFHKEQNHTPKYDSYFGISFIKQENFDKIDNDSDNFEYNKFPYENILDTHTFTQTLEAKASSDNVANILILFKVFGDQNIRLNYIKAKCVVIKNYNLND